MVVCCQSIIQDASQEADTKRLVGFRSAYESVREVPKGSFGDVYLDGVMLVGSEGLHDLLVTDKELQTGISPANLNISLGRPRP